jgi:hypothetical protein
MCQYHFDTPSPKQKSPGLKPDLRDDRPARTELVFMYEERTKARGKLYIFSLADHIFEIMILPVIEDTTKCPIICNNSITCYFQKLKHLEYGFLECDSVLVGE